MTTQQLDTTGFIVNGRSIESITYRDYLNQYGSDETTTPQGIGARLHIREVQVDDCVCAEIDEQGNILHDDNCCDEHTEYQVWSWGFRGSHPSYTGQSFDSEEEAELHIYECKEHYISNHDNAPIFWHKHADAVEELAGSLDRSVETTRRYLDIQAITERKHIEHRNKVTAEYEAMKAWLAINVPIEAAKIEIDEQFKLDMIVAAPMTGKDKSNFIERAFSLLLNRRNITITTDFWQVLRIVKSRV